MSAAAGGVSLALVTRADLDLSRGKLAAQCSHAAVACAATARCVAARLAERWRAAGGRTIVLQVPDLTALERLYGEARAAGLVSEMIRDAGHTEVPAGTVTVVGIGPAPVHALDALIGELETVR